jgi:hypothetical protein
MALIAEKFGSNNQKTAYDFDPGGTSIVNVAWVSMQEFEGIVGAFVRTIGTSAFTMIVRVATDSGGTGAVTAATKTVSSEPDAVADLIQLECTSDMMLEALADATHATLAISVATGTDEGVVTYDRYGSTYPRRGLNADVIA